MQNVMPLDPEFKQHLHSLMVEVYEETYDEIADDKEKRVWDALQTHNDAAIPLAYRDAALYAIETRVEKTIEKYVEAVSIGGFETDPAFEKEMIQQFNLLTSGPKRLQFPPMMQRGPHIEAVQDEFARARTRLAIRLVRKGTNRLRELKMKRKQDNRITNSGKAIQFNGPVGVAYVDSVVQITNNNFTLNEATLQDIDRVSEGNVELEAAAQEIRKTQERGTSPLEKIQKWATLLSTVAGLAEKVHQYHPRLEALISRLKQLGLI